MLSNASSVTCATLVMLWLHVDYMLARMSGLWMDPVVVIYIDGTTNCRMYTCLPDDPVCQMNIIIVPATHIYSGSRYRLSGLLCTA